MKVPLSWLKAYVEIEDDPREVARPVTLAGVLAFPLSPWERVGVRVKENDVRDTVARARALRRRAPDVEMRLWRLLRAGQIGGAKFRRQHPIGPYFADFYCHRAKLVVELDGGGHAEDAQSEADARRTAWLQHRGLRVLRFWDNDVLQNPEGVLERIMAAVVSPHPRPLPQGEGTTTRGMDPPQRDSQIHPASSTS
ncbi:MAG: DUF559 domain-containing protein [Chloroflexi bacterium]|nr:DUF559 domain-containing protein [Chloroflexota bacterium]